MNREFAIGMAKVKENDFVSAIEFFTQAISQEPSNADCYAERAVAYIHTQQYELSMFDMNKCVDLEPKNSYRYSCRAYLKSKIGDVDGAIADYEMAVKLDPEDAIAYNNLGLAQEAKGYKKKAVESFDKSNKIIGYNPQKFDEGKTINNKTETENKTKSVEAEETKGQVVKGVFTTKSGFKEFIRFIKNGFKIKS